MKPLKPILAASLIANLAAMAAGGVYIHHKGGAHWLLNKAMAAALNTPAKPAGEYAATKGSVYSELHINPGDIVFAGDSLLDYGEWSELLNNPTAKNRAVSGSTTAHVLASLPSIMAGKPGHIVIGCGINNLQQGGRPAAAIADYIQMVGLALESSDSTEVWFMPVLPVNRALYREWILAGRPSITMPDPADVAALNNALRSLTGPRVHFLEVEVTDGDQMAEDYTFDGLHMNGAGLAKVAQAIKSAISGRLAGN